MVLLTDATSSTLHLEIHALTNEVASTVRAVLSNLDTDAKSFTASWAAKLEELGDVPPPGALCSDLPILRTKFCAIST
jgi:hypothetical protein